MIGSCSPRCCLLMSGWTILTLFVLAGCGSERKVSIDGKVTIDGVLANSGEVIFARDDGSMIFPLRIRTDGTYHGIDVSLGSMKVAVKPAPQVSKRWRDKSLRSIRAKKNQQAVAGPAVPIPKKYHDADSSGLTTTIRPGANIYDIELSSK